MPGRIGRGHDEYLPGLNPLSPDPPSKAQELKDSFREEEVLIVVAGRKKMVVDSMDQLNMWL